ncbi:MAG: (2Fe-2S)-binding protein [Armatimonadota bacterium]
MRVNDHPILGSLAPADEVCISLDGRPVTARAGEPIAAALLANGVRMLRRTEKRRHPRGLFCARGQCTDCVMTVDGLPNVRTCVTPVRQGMVIETDAGS